MNLLKEASDSKFVTRKWNNANDQSNINYDTGIEIIQIIQVLKSNLCDYNESYILVRGVKFKLKWTMYCVLSAAGADTADANSNNIIFTIKDTKLYVPVATLSAKDNQKLLQFLSKGFESSVYWNEYKTKSENKNTRK